MVRVILFRRNIDACTSGVRTMYNRFRLLDRRYVSGLEYMKSSHGDFGDSRWVYQMCKSFANVLMDSPLLCLISAYDLRLVILQTGQLSRGSCERSTRMRNFSENLNGSRNRANRRWSNVTPRKVKGFGYQIRRPLWWHMAIRCLAACYLD